MLLVGVVEIKILVVDLEIPFATSIGVTGEGDGSILI